MLYVEKNKIFQCKIYKEKLIVSDDIFWSLVSYACYNHTKIRWERKKWREGWSILLVIGGHGLRPRLDHRKFEGWKENCNARLIPEKFVYEKKA